MRIQHDFPGARPNPSAALLRLSASGETRGIAADGCTSFRCERDRDREAAPESHDGTDREAPSAAVAVERRELRGVCRKIR
jgi:hypothetical protein